MLGIPLLELQRMADPVCGDSLLRKEENGEILLTGARLWILVQCGALTRDLAMTRQVQNKVVLSSAEQQILKRWSACSAKANCTQRIRLAAQAGLTETVRKVVSEIDPAALRRQARQTVGYCFKTRNDLKSYLRKNREDYRQEALEQAAANGENATAFPDSPEELLSVSAIVAQAESAAHDQALLERFLDDTFLDCSVLTLAQITERFYAWCRDNEIMPDNLDARRIRRLLRKIEKERRFEIAEADRPDDDDRDRDEPKRSEKAWEPIEEKHFPFEDGESGFAEAVAVYETGYLEGLADVISGNVRLPFRQKQGSLAGEWLRSPEEYARHRAYLAMAKHLERESEEYESRVIIRTLASPYLRLKGKVSRQMIRLRDESRTSLNVTCRAGKDEIGMMHAFLDRESSACQRLYAIPREVERRPVHPDNRHLRDLLERLLPLLSLLNRTVAELGWLAEWPYRSVVRELTRRARQKGIGTPPLPAIGYGVTLRQTAAEMQKLAWSRPRHWQAMKDEYGRRLADWDRAKELRRTYRFILGFVDPDL